jgi:hypothetical protein
VGTEPVDFCREIESYLCQKNDGHLVRVTGPSFDLVAGWAAKGIPLKIAFEGIDRYFERYYRKGPRRRPVRIDFCDADVLDAFDQWRRALGLPLLGRPGGEVGEADEAGGASEDGEAGEDGEGGRAAPPGVAAPEGTSRGSLPAHLHRVVLRLTSARATGSLDEAFVSVVDRVARELDAARAAARGVRGEARQALLERLASLDAELLSEARRSLSPDTVSALAREAGDELSSFRDRMAADAYARAHAAAVDRLVRNRLKLPTITLT